MLPTATLDHYISQHNFILFFTDISQLQANFSHYLNSLSYLRKVSSDKLLSTPPLMVADGDGEEENTHNHDEFDPKLLLDPEITSNYSIHVASNFSMGKFFPVIIVVVGIVILAIHLKCKQAYNKSTNMLATVTTPEENDHKQIMFPNQVADSDLLMKSNSIITTGANILPFYTIPSPYYHNQTSIQSSSLYNENYDYQWTDSSPCSYPHYSTVLHLYKEPENSENQITKEGFICSNNNRKNKSQPHYEAYYKLLQLNPNQNISQHSKDSQCTSLVTDKHAQQRPFNMHIEDIVTILEQKLSNDEFSSHNLAYELGKYAVF